MIQDERDRQISEENFGPQHDDDYIHGELAMAAVAYIKYNEHDNQCPEEWPWSPEWWKPGEDIRNLVKAGALIAAEIDRLNRQEEGNTQ